MLIKILEWCFGNPEQPKKIRQEISLTAEEEGDYRRMIESNEGNVIGLRTYDHRTGVTSFKIVWL